jgi:hypothetical protein
VKVIQSNSKALKSASLELFHLLSSLRLMLLVFVSISKMVKKFAISAIALALSAQHFTSRFIVWLWWILAYSNGSSDEMMTRSGDKK